MTYGTLDICDGEECPYCGCRDTTEREFGIRWGQAIIKWVCRHCGGTFTPKKSTVQEHQPSTKDISVHHVVDEARPGMVVYRLVRCPVDQGGCGSGNTKITSTRKPLRSHKCKDCGISFKSTEIE